jgi:hypothetical protein
LCWHTCWSVKDETMNLLQLGPIQFTTWKQLADPTDDNRKCMICQLFWFPVSSQNIYTEEVALMWVEWMHMIQYLFDILPSFQSNWEGKPKASKDWNLTENNPWWKGGGNRWEIYLRSMCKENKAWIHEE